VVVSELDALLRAVADRPDDLTASLVLADWYDDAPAAEPCPRCEGRQVVETAAGRTDCDRCHGAGSFPTLYRNQSYRLRLGVALRGVLVDPDADAPRLAYAGVCEAYGRAERAEFVRVGCELAKVLREPGWVPPADMLVRHPVGDIEMLFRLNNYDRESRAEALRRRERELFGAHGREWFGPAVHLGDVPPGPRGGFGVRRGFVWKLVTTFEAFAGFPCPQCVDDPQFWASRLCTLCDDGRIAGHARAAFPAHPVTRVECPGAVQRGMVCCVGHGNDVPADLWAALRIPRCPGQWVECIGAGTHAHMDERSLSDTLVAHGRSLAGLPPLPPTESTGGE
jgi:uncharacterized protein (TIGR02996 family)